jgi:hypothetical protein
MLIFSFRAAMEFRHGGDGLGISVFEQTRAAERFQSGDFSRPFGT